MIPSTQTARTHVYACHSNPSSQHNRIRMTHSSINKSTRFRPNILLTLQMLLPMIMLLLLSLLITPTNAFGVTTASGNSTYDTVEEPIDYAPPRFTVLFPWFIQVIGVIVFFIITRYELIIPFQAIMFMIGAACGIVSTIRYNAIDPTSHSIIDELDQLSISILQWSTIDSAVLLLVFLPGLIFRDAIEGNFMIVFMMVL